jgi:adenosylcobinamide-phosphate synthase
MLTPAVASLATDLMFGEPPSAWHPTVAMGNWIGGCRRRRRSRHPLGATLEGVATIAGGMLLTAGAVRQAEWLIERLPANRRAVIQGLALKPSLSIDALLRAARRVQRLLAANRLDAARCALGRDLVSRDTHDLSVSEVAGATMESVAENFSDSFVAPLLAFRLGGLRAAYLYRFINTADAMLGYRTAELEWFGKPAARLDDIANLIPSRVSALLIAITAPAGGGSSRRALRIAFADAGRTASPNAGWPMAAMAGALNVRLTKRGHYALNSRARQPVAADIARCRSIVLAASGFAAAAVDAL